VLVVERYYHGATPASYFNVYSVTKSVTSALIGIALGDHTLAGLDQRVGRLLASHLPPKPDPRRCRRRRNPPPLPSTPLIPRALPQSQVYHNGQSGR